jgi:uncharacterized phage protein (TIGR02220 family)
MKSIKIPLEFLKAIGEKPHPFRIYWIKWLSDYHEHLFRPDFCEFFQNDMLGKNLNLETIKEAYDFGIGFFKDGIQIEEKNKRAKRQYAQEITDFADKVLDYLNSRSSTTFTKSKTNMDVIVARMKEGYTLTDFKIVIDKKCSQWLNTEQQVYLRPITLFSNKFENYLNEAETITQNEPKQQPTRIDKIRFASDKAKGYINHILSKQG